LGGRWRAIRAVAHGIASLPVPDKRVDGDLVSAEPQIVWNLAIALRTQT
jgi:hypothetical protein